MLITLKLKYESLLMFMTVLLYARKILRRIIPLSNRIWIANTVHKVIRVSKAFILKATRPKLYLNFIAQIITSVQGKIPQAKLKNHLHVIPKLNDVKRFALKQTRQSMNSLTSSRLFLSPMVHKPIRRLLEFRFKKKELKFWKSPRLNFVPEPKKVLLVIGTLGGGGAERQLCYLASELKKLGWTAVVAVNNLQGEDNCKLYPLLRQAAVEVFEIDTLSLREEDRNISESEYPMFQSARKLGRIVEKVKPSVIHSWMDYANCESLLIKDSTENCRYVLGLRSINPENFIFWSPSFRPIYRKFANGEVKLVSNSSAGRDSYKRWLNRKNISVVPNGIVTETMRSQPIKSSYDRTEKLMIVGCMRLSYEKGPDIWVEVAKRICQMREGIEFHLFGTGQMFSYLKEEIQRVNLASRIFLHGYQENPWNRKTWDIHLSTSRAEGMPNAVMEASVMEVPTVGFNVGGVGEILGSDAIFLAPKSDFQKLIEKLEFAIDSEKSRLTEAKRAKQKVESEFGFRTMALHYVAVYESGKVS